MTTETETTTPARRPEVAALTRALERKLRQVNRAKVLTAKLENEALVIRRQLEGWLRDNVPAAAGELLGDELEGAP